MNFANGSRLILLAAIWGGSFLFTRISAPVLGPVILIQSRVALALLLLLVVALFNKRRLEFRSHWRHYLVFGTLNTAIPFLLFAYSAQTLSAADNSILNATTPIWGALIGAVWKRDALNKRVILGLLLGITGVGLVVGLDRVNLPANAGLAVAACLLATACYGIASNYARATHHVDSFSNAQGSMLIATLVILPALPFSSVHTQPDTTVILAVLAVGILCTGFAFLLFFRLLREIGATSTLTVTFLIPAFGILWGHLFLHEEVTAGMLIGCGVVLVGTVLVTGFNPRVLWRARKPLTRG